MKFVFDLDGTICFKGQPLSTGITAALEDCLVDGLNEIRGITTSVYRIWQ